MVEPTRIAPWKKQANCRDTHVGLFFPEEHKANATYEHARWICRPCPVKQECLEDSLTTDPQSAHQHGMRGGLTPNERRDLLGWKT